jgi:hypothetical protein
LESLTTGNRDPDLQAQVDQAKEQTRVANENARLNAQALATFGGSGDIGAGGRNAIEAAQGGVVVNIHSFIPPSIAQATQAAGWITGGLDAQGSRQSPRRAVG